jgi:hypothetical protein
MGMSNQQLAVFQFDNRHFLLVGCAELPTKKHVYSRELLSIGITGRVATKTTNNLGLFSIRSVAGFGLFFCMFFSSASRVCVPQSAATRETKGLFI